MSAEQAGSRSDPASTPRRAAQLHLGIALDDAGADAAAWRLPGAADGLLGAERLVRLAGSAERGLFDFVALDDSFDPPDPHGVAQASRLPFHFDALLALARVAPATSAVGLLATVTTTHTEPFHVSKNVATLDLVSAGRAGWRVAPSASEAAARRFGRKAAAPPDELYAEADDAVEVVRRLWDSWEDDAVIRDRSTGRYVDRDRLHYIDFEGRFFNVRGPSITPRSPQGQPLVAIDADRPEALDVAARRADIVFLHEPDPTRARARREDLRRRVQAAGREPDTVAVMVVAQVGEPATRRRLDGLLGTVPPARPGAAPSAPAGAPPAPVGASLDLVGDGSQVAAVLEDWFVAGAADGFLLRPDVLPDTLDWLVAEVVPVLQSRGRFRRAYEGGTLRDRFGLDRPANRYAPTTATEPAPETNPTEVPA